MVVKVHSNEIPTDIEQVGNKVYLRKNVEDFVTEDFSGYQYDEILVEGYTFEFVTEHYEDIFMHPENYNVVQINGRYV